MDFLVWTLGKPSAEVLRKVTLCVVVSAVINVKGVVGEQGTCSGKDILVKTKGSKNVTQDRYRMEDKGDVFYVTFKNLRKTDSGTYWCGVDRPIKDTFQAVYLTVTDGKSITVVLNNSNLPNLSTTSSNLSTMFLASGNNRGPPSSRAGMMNLSSQTLQLI
uniref:Immunoglobulin V-set domain-containing protein n=1 Tax=Hucho hucho TaxID=62062 RepID=A0A4W5K7G5_9TELE